MKPALLLSFALLSCSAPSGIPRNDQPISGVSQVATINETNNPLPFYFYLPAKILKDKASPHPLIICVPPLSARGETFVAPETKTLADELGAAVIAPSFRWDQQNWESGTSYQYPAAWSGDALLSIIDKVKDTQGLRFSKFCLLGFSAGAQFALRFALWRPDLCLAVAAHAAGGRVIPTRSIPVEFLIGLGKDDILDRRAHAIYFYESAKRLGIAVTFVEYPVAHGFSPAQLTDSLYFFRRVLKTGRKS